MHEMLDHRVFKCMLGISINGIWCWYKARAIDPLQIALDLMRTDVLARQVAPPGSSRLYLAVSVLGPGENISRGSCLWIRGHVHLLRLLKVLLGILNFGYEILKAQLLRNLPSTQLILHNKAKPTLNASTTCSGDIVFFELPSQTEFA